MRIFIIAGEASGDLLGAALMKGLAAQTKEPLEYRGVGGPAMNSMGLSSLFEMSELSVMGLAEVLPKYRQLRRRMAQTVEAVISFAPDLLITIDSPDFCLRVAKAVKARADVPVVHYVAPSVWAWRPGRAARMVGVVDHVMAILPFEPPYMHEVGISCDFVGHPIAAQPVPTKAQRDALRARLRVSDRLILALPGSRAGEIARLAPRFGEALAGFSGATVIVPAAPGREAQIMAEAERWQIPHQVITARDAVEKSHLFAAADLALAASGTVALELAAVQTPMVIGYDMARVTGFLMRRMASIDTVTLVNLVSETKAVPELLLEQCTPTALAKSMRGVLANPGPQIDAMNITMERLGRGGQSPGHRAASSVLRFMESRRAS